MSKLTAACMESLSDAVRYWERMRIAYNLVLATLSLACWGPQILSGRAVDFFGGLIVLAFFATIANLCYCTAYPVDVAIQLTPMRDYRRHARWSMFLCGTCLAVACALWVLLGDHMA